MVPRVRDWRGATIGAVRSGAQHRSERGAPQSPTPYTHNGKNSYVFAVMGVGGNAQIKKKIITLLQNHKI